MRSQVFPIIALSYDVELIISAMCQAKQMLLGNLGDVDVAANGEIDERRGDVLHIRLVVDQRPQLGGRFPGDRLVADDVRSFRWIASLFVPGAVREAEDEQRNQ